MAQTNTHGTCLISPTIVRSKVALYNLNQDILFDEMSHTIAVVTTFYNDQAVVTRLLKSLLGQTCFDFTHYIYDDGSEDNPRCFFDNYGNELEKKGAGYCFVAGDNNVGVDKAHEAVFKRIKEPYFIWVDADDWVDRKFIQKLLVQIRRHPNCALFHLNSWQYDAQMNRAPHSTAYYYNRKALSNHDQFPYICLDTDEWYAHQCLVKMSEWEAINPERKIFDKRLESAPYYDAQIFFELAFIHSEFRYIRKPLSNIFNRADSVTHMDRKRGFPSTMLEKHDEHYSHGCFYFDKFSFPKSDVELYFQLVPWRRRSLEILDLIKRQDLARARKLMRQYKTFLSINKLPSSYFLFRTAIRHALMKSVFGNAISFAKKVLKR